MSDVLQQDRLIRLVSKTIWLGCDPGSGGNRANGISDVPDGTNLFLARASPGEAALACPVCAAHNPQEAISCGTCDSQLFFCPKCRTNVEVTSKRRFVGLRLGGMQTQMACRVCNRILIR